MERNISQLVQSIPGGLAAVAKDGFDVARVIAGWLDGQMEKAALRQIDREERRLKGEAHGTGRSEAHQKENFGSYSERISPEIEHVSAFRESMGNGPGVCRS